MKLPERVEAAIEILKPYQIDRHQIAPLWYQWFLQFRPTTPPPLFDASKGAWAFLGLLLALPIGVVLCAIVWRGLEPIVQGIGVPYTLFFILIATSVFATLASSTTRNIYANIRESIGLPTQADGLWEGFGQDWQPSVPNLRDRADADRFWLRSLWPSPWFRIAGVCGFIAFTVTGQLDPTRLSATFQCAVAVFYFLTSFALTSSQLRQALAPKIFRLWPIVNGAAFGVVLAGLLWAILYSETFLREPRGVMTLSFAVIGLLCHVQDAFLYQQRKLLAESALRAEHERLLAEAKLEKLKAQIEPHFIFNTLAHLRRLITTDSKTAERMAEALSDFLRANLKSMQSNWTTVEEDFKLVEAYLELAKLRIGERLNSTISTVFEAKSIQIPPMMLLTLLENAIQHAVEPNTGITQIDVTAKIEAVNQLVIRVVDTGAGFGVNKTGGSGLGLANIRERLQSIYAGKAELRFTANVPSGVIAELHLPIYDTAARRGTQT
jgi:signal transduction histidine kinase